MRRLLKIDDVCKILGVARSTVWKMTRDGRLKSISLGAVRTVRFREEDVQELIDDFTTRRRVG
jgi:excisionase family DNA binding protein